MGLFGFEPDEDGKPKTSDTAICRICSKAETAKGSNTSNLFAHLGVHHPRKYTEVECTRTRRADQPQCSTTASGQQTFQGGFSKGKKYERRGKKWQQLTDAVTYCIAKDMMSIYSIEKDGIHKLLHTFDSQYELPGRKYFAQTAIPTLYATTRKTVRKAILCAEFFSATTDMWSSTPLSPILATQYTSWMLSGICSPAVSKPCICQKITLQTICLPRSRTLSMPGV